VLAREPDAPAAEAAAKSGGNSERATGAPVVPRQAPDRAPAFAAEWRPIERPVERTGIVYMARPLERDPALAGYTYKLKWPGSDHAIYVTINDIERDGRRRPFEIFINTKNLEHYAWTVALTRMISAIFRRGGDVSFVVEELKAVFDPQGGQWMEGRYVPSLLAAIGSIIEHHMLRIGFLLPDPAVMPAGEGLPGQPAGASQIGEGSASSERVLSSAVHAPNAAAGVGARRCPRCQVGGLILQSGCWVCRDCGYAKCG